MGSESDVAAWAKAHGAGYEVAALIEQVRGRRAQIGFTVRLFARMPMDERPQKERWAEAVDIRNRLREILQSLAPASGGRGRLEIEAPRSAATLDPTRELEPEISVVGRVFHGDDYFAEVTESDRTKVYEGVKRLAEMGIPEGGSRSK
jgi:hypothetical protein